MRGTGILLFAFGMLVHAADEQLASLASAAVSAFERVQLSAVPQLRDTSACVQAEAALLARSAADDLPQAHFRKGFCTLAGGAITADRNAFTAAAAEFDRAVESWAGKPVVKNRPAEPVPPVLRVYAALARLEAAADDAAYDRAGAELRSALTGNSCTSGVMTDSLCRAAADAGHEWLGWLALRKDDLAGAASDLQLVQSSGWAEWVAGRLAFRDRKYSDAARHYRRAIEQFEARAGRPLVQQLGPREDRPADLAELGGTQLLAGDVPAAIATLDAAVKARPGDPHALYLRGLAKEAAHQETAALADFNLASRTAFAAAKDLASGEAHLYRGIVFYRRKDYSHAEDEFASALNFTIAPEMRADAVAWRHMAAVAAGGCEASRQYLERSLAAVSPFFPKSEARDTMANCTTAAGAQAGAQ